MMIDVKELENYVAESDIFDSFELDNINVESLLFQTGYLTIKQVIEHDVDDREYILSYPNKEVKESLVRNILNSFLEVKRSTQVALSRMVRALKKNDLEEFFKNLKDIFSHITAVIFMADKEAYYHTIFYLILTLIGVRIKAEVHTNKGRIDAVIETDEKIYIMEFKMSSTTQALKQIRDKKYYESYLLSKKDILLLGVSFDSNERNIKEWEIKTLTKF